MLQVLNDFVLDHCIWEPCAHEHFLEFSREESTIKMSQFFIQTSKKYMDERRIILLSTKFYYVTESWNRPQYSRNDEGILIVCHVLKPMQDHCKLAILQETQGSKRPNVLALVSLTTIFGFLQNSTKHNHPFVSIRSTVFAYVNSN